MILTEDERDSISKVVGEDVDFYRIVDGWIQLKNHDGRCIFHDGKNCQIYNCRPKGCLLYPIVFDIDDGPIYDAICPYPQAFPMTEDIKKMLLDHVDVLMKERSCRLGLA